MTLTAENMHFQVLNEAVRTAEDTQVVIDNCCGQRYIGDGLSDKEITIHGTPGNALGAYLDGARIEVFGNAQDATGDTMNDGAIVIHGSSGDATGYAMRGGKIFVQGNAGYRAGIHMKAYKEKLPVLVIGGEAGSFLGEYQAGGIILVLGLHGDGETFFSNFCATGMHGGKIIVRCKQQPDRLPPQIDVRRATAEDMADIDGYLNEFCEAFEYDKAVVKDYPYYVLTPDTKNPYKQLYTAN